jgi:3-hydroxybutyryl-CoA dehydrogenase
MVFRRRFEEKSASFVFVGRGAMAGKTVFKKIGILGMGRMSIGLAIDLALNGLEIDMIDLKARPADQRRQYEIGLRQECEKVVKLLNRKIESFRFPAYLDTPAPGIYDIIFEGLPEKIPLKHAAFAVMSESVGQETLICSMTSTFTVEELCRDIDPPLSIVVTHFMNPPYLLPFLEVVPHPGVKQGRVDKLLTFLKSVGHMPIICQSSPGFVISRLQLCVMNEAVRLMQEGVASPEDIDKAIKFGWGYRFPIMGILEFIDVGGLEILYHASRSVSKELNRPDLECPELIVDRFNEGAIGTKTLKGIFNYESHAQVAEDDRARLKRQIRLKTLLDAIHREDGTWQ